MPKKKGGSSQKKDFYELLGVSRDATTNEIKKAYRKLAIEHHPDKGGDEEVFKEITHAFEVLSDEDKRPIYDRYGEEGLQDGGAGVRDPSDIFEAMFGGGMGGGFFGGMGSSGGRKGPRKSEDLVHTLNVKLADFYKGKTSKLAITRHRKCEQCNGKGTPDPNGISVCRDCGGNGVRVKMRQIGPGMVQQSQVVCSECSGKGEIVSGPKCVSCNGKKLKQEKKILEVFIDPGMQHGQKITFSGEADEEPDTLPGDVVIVLKQEPHSIFERKGQNLFMEKEISLADALCGAEFVVNHLDDRSVVIRAPKGRPISHGEIKAVPGEGMPQWKNPFDKGYLFISFKVKFPDNIPAQVVPELERVLGKRSRPQIPSNEHVDEHEMLDFNPEMARATSTGQGEAYMEDEDTGRRQNVQCAHQ